MNKKKIKKYSKIHSFFYQNIILMKIRTDFFFHLMKYFTKFKQKIAEENY